MAKRRLQFGPLGTWSEPVTVAEMFAGGSSACRVGYTPVVLGFFNRSKRVHYCLRKKGMGSLNTMMMLQLVSSRLILRSVTTSVFVEYLLSFFSLGGVAQEAYQYDYSIEKPVYLLFSGPGKSIG